MKMEAVENGIEVAAQTSVVTAVNGAASPMKNPWKTKYLILKRKCDQIDQVSCNPSRGLHGRVWKVTC